MIKTNLTTNQKIIVAPAVTIAVIVAAALLIYARTIHTTGVLATVGIEIYQDQALTTKLETIAWQTIRPGETKLTAAYIKNTRILNVTLALTTSNYQPTEAQQYLITTWNYANGTVLQPNQTVTVEIYLTVSQDARNVTNFTYDIAVTATEKR